MNSIDEVFSSLNSISIDKADMSASFKTIQRHYFKIFQDLLSEFRQFKLDRNTHVFRVRKNQQDVLFTKPDELSHAPVDNTELGRVNLPRKPVFYCSDKLSTSILEVKPKIGDYLTLAESILSEDILLAVIGNCNRYNVVGDQSTDLKLFYDKITPIITRRVQDEKEYLFTAILADVVFSDLKFNGIIYPSCYSKTKSDNFAFRPSDLNQKLYFYSATLLQVVEWHNEFSITVKCIAKTNKLDSTKQFIWRKVHECKTHPIRFDMDPPDIIDT